MRLSDLEGVDPITPGELNGAVKKGDPTVLRCAATLLDAWATRQELQSRAVAAESALASAEARVASIARVLPRASNDTLQDVAQITAFAVQMLEVRRRVVEVCAAIRRDGGQSATIADSIESLVTDPTVPAILDRRTT